MKKEIFRKRQDVDEEIRRTFKLDLVLAVRPPRLA